jgi:farnesyl-diphosphate farnesyltransferase
LLRRLPECWDWLGALGEPHRRAVREVLAEITAGQDWDLERFGEAGRESPACCRTAAELDAYTYRVAGCVGEFWTRVGLMSLGGRFAPAEAEAELLVSGRSLGQGLQLVNILRDLGADLEAGRCYLPEEELIAAGWREGRREAALAAVAAAWRTRCREALRPGWSYVARLRRGRARVATALPLILAEKTLDALEAAGAEATLRRRVKVTRGAVWVALARALVA